MKRNKVWKVEYRRIRVEWSEGGGTEGKRGKWETGCRQIGQFPEV